MYAIRAGRALAPTVSHLGISLPVRRAARRTATSSCVGSAQGVRVQVQELQGQVQEARQAASQPSKQLELVNLIEAGARDVRAFYATEHERLHEIVAQQTSIVEIVERQSVAAATLVGMAESMVGTLEGVDRGAADVAAALRRVAAQQTLTPAEMLALWKTTRRRSAQQRKVVRLANTPCSGAPDAGGAKQIEEHAFQTQSDGSLAQGVEVRMRLCVLVRSCACGHCCTAATSVRVGALTHGGHDQQHPRRHAHPRHARRARAVPERALRPPL